MHHKGIKQRIKFGEGVIVTDCAASVFPDMLLRIKIRTARREEHYLQARIGSQKVLDRLAFVPGAAIL